MYYSTVYNVQCILCSGHSTCIVYYVHLKRYTGTAALCTDRIILKSQNLQNKRNYSNLVFTICYFVNIRSQIITCLLSSKYRHVRHTMSCFFKDIFDREEKRGNSQLENANVHVCL